MKFDFKDKTVIVTGGARGIGAAISTLFARTGANVMIDYIPVKRDIEGLKKLEGLLGGIKASYATYAGDITSPENMEKLCKDTVDKFGSLDILVNCAGFTTPANIEKGHRDQSFGCILHHPFCCKVYDIAAGGSHYLHRLGRFNHRWRRFGFLFFFQSRDQRIGAGAVKRACSVWYYGECCIAGLD